MNFLSLALRLDGMRNLRYLFQIACAMEHNAALLTNDKALRKITETPVFLLDSELFR